MCPLPPPDVSPQEETLSRGVTIGRYVVLSLVGRGGMGHVYAAYDPELDRRVAIKLMRAEASAVGFAPEQDSGRARLMREAKVIAKLSHPNVVVIHDVGTFGDQVFIAMEFVEGQTLRSWLSARDRSWAEVLKVLAPAGRGLAAAHDKNLIHRDFKPDNVMVTDDGQVRVMDFGLARLVGAPPAGASSNAEQVPVAAPGAGAAPEDDERALTMGTVVGRHAALSPRPPRVVDISPEGTNHRLTQTGTLMGTPAYMGPEQLLPRPTDARTDQFSFCVTLYEALYGERPFQGPTLAALTETVLRGKPRPPPAGSKVPAWLRKVVLRGLSVVPDQRWPSMYALLAELERNRAVAGRHRFSARAAAKLVGIWEAPTVGRGGETTSKAAIRQAFLATGKRYAAQTFDNVSRVLDRYAAAWANMYTSACEATHTFQEQSVEVLELRLGALQDALQALRALCDAFRGATAEVVEKAVDAANALPSIERCADVALLRTVIRPPESPTLRATVDHLGRRLAEVRASSRVGRLAHALKLLAELEDEVRATDYRPLMAETLLERGHVHEERCEWDAAARSYEEALWMAERIRHQEVAAEAATQLVGMTAQQARFELGDVWAKYAETILDRVGGHDRLLGWLFNNISLMRQMQGRLAESLESCQRAIAIKESNLGGEHPDLGISIGNLAFYLTELGDPAQAVAHGERAIKILEAAWGAEHPRTAVYLANHSETLTQLGRFSEARTMAQRALTILERETEPDGILVTAGLIALGLADLGDGVVGEALPMLERAARNRETDEIGAPHRLGEVHFALARALAAAEQGADRARLLAERARQEYRQAIPSPVTERVLTAIDAWLAAHPLSARATVV